MFKKLLKKVVEVERTEEQRSFKEDGFFVFEKKVSVDIHIPPRKKPKRE